jgi:hypothetical protein
VSGPRSSLALTLLAIAMRGAEFDPWFGDGKELQRDQPIVVRGTARAGAAVLVRLGDVGIGVDADADGRWTARFPARPASTRPVELEAKDGVADARLGDILVGDVWLAAGQSNMEFTLRREAHAAEELPKATAALVRLRHHAFAGQYHGASRLDAETIARLTPDQAMYHFLSGYTARVAGTEIGVTEPEATFSTCFGAPFMPRHPSVYGNLLKERIAKGGVKCWLVNTGWSGGKATMEGIKRMPIKATRALLNAALDGSLNEAEFRKDPNFGFEVPVAVAGVDSRLLDPRGAWADGADYDKTAQELVHKFVDNFQQFADHVDESVRQAAPVAA